MTATARQKQPAPMSIRPAGRYGDSVRLLIRLAAQPPASAPSVPPIPTKAKSRLPWCTSKMSTMNAQKTLVVKRLMTVSQT